MLNVVKGLLDLELVPIQDKMIESLTASEKVATLLVGPPGAGNNYVLAVYAIVRAIENPGSNVVIATQSFDLSKQVFSHCESILNKKTCSVKFKGCFHDTDRHWVDMQNGSTIQALALDTNRIRGKRAHTLIMPSFASISKDIFEQIICGFAVIDIDPIEKAKQPLGMDFDEIGDMYKAKRKQRMVLSELDETVPYFYMKGAQEGKSMDLIEVARSDFPKGWWDDRKVARNFYPT